MSSRPISFGRRQLTCVFGAALVAGACHRSVSREEVLRALVDQVVALDLVEVERRSRELARAAGRLANAPSEPEFTALRAAWRRAALAWKRASAFRAGPLLSSEALQRASYWPARSAAVREVLASARAPSALLVAELGADVKGLYALEYLLFDESADSVVDSSASRARGLIRAYAEDIRAQAEGAHQLLRTRGFAGEFARGGQQSLNRIVGLLAESIENMLAARLNLALWLASLQRLRPNDVEGGPSRTSHALALQLLLASQRLYLGGARGGLSELVERVAPTIQQRINQAFADAVAALRSLGAPIETVAVNDRPRVEAAFRAVKALEQALKNDLPSSLGVTLAFTALDAD